MPKSVNKKTQKKSSSKRKVPKRTSSQKRIFWGCFSLFLVIFLVVVGKLLNYLNSPSFSFAHPTDKKNYTYLGNTTINLVFKTDSVYSLFYTPHEKMAVVLKIPDDSYLDLAFGFGKYPTRSIYDLGQVDTVTMGGRLLKHTISSLEGTIIDGIVVSQDPKDFRSPVKLVEQLKQNPFAIFPLTARLESDLSKLELLKLFWDLKGVRADNLSLVDLGNSSITKSLLLADGSRGLGIDQAKLDLLLQSKLKDVKVMDEGLSIGVINGTTHPRLAESVARIINNLGGRVIFMTNSQANYSQSFVLGKPSYTTTRLSQFFAPHCLPSANMVLSWIKKPQCVINDPEILSSRAQISVVLGEDFYAKQNLK